MFLQTDQIQHMRGIKADAKAPLPQVVKGRREPLFGHHYPTSFLLMMVAEWASALIALYAGLILLGQWSEAELWHPYESALVQGSLVALLLLMGMGATGLYHPRQRITITGTLLRLAVSLLFVNFAMGALIYLFPILHLEPLDLSLLSLLAVGAIAITRTLFWLFVIDLDALKQRILVLGTGTNAASINGRLRRNSDRRGFTVVGHVRCGDEKVLVGRTTLLSHNKSLLELAREYDVDEIVVAVDERRKHLPVDQLMACAAAGVEVIELQTFFERESGRVPLDNIHPACLLFSEHRSHNRAGDAVKRIFDILAALTFLLLAWPVMLVVAVAIYLEDGDPVVFQQLRVGRDGRLFKVFKFRSMRMDAEGDGIARFASEDDERITRVGRFIRKTRLDELPQLLNVLRGDMSFVGPRPERPEFVEQFNDSIPYYDLRHSVKPGITGWAQISYPYGGSERAAIHKLELDLYYVKNRSLLMDLFILLQTAEVVLWGKGGR
jgi:sugar transferase (PEP-CTERM system associated)